MKRASFGVLNEGTIFWHRGRSGEGHWYIKRGVRGAYTCDMHDNHYKTFKRAHRVTVPQTLERIFAGM
jgi:hypothetical protein